MEDGFTKFLLDKENDFTLYKKHDDGNYYLRKENIGEDDRFQLIYYKSLDKKRLEVEYSVAGIYDTKETTIYNLSYPFMNSVPANSKIHSSDFGTVEYEMIQKINKGLNQYLIEHKDSIKKYGLNKYRELQNNQIQSLKRETEKVFITSSNPKIEYKFDVTAYTIYETLNSERSFEILKYLREPEKYINDIVGKIIDNKKEEYGLYILKNNDKEKYLIELSKNKSGKYNDIYLNKTIYDSIKYTYARTLNITIEYGGKELSFNYDYENFINALSRNERGTSDYRNNYSAISNFIRENTHSDKYDKYRNDFEFDHIKTIRYSKKELFNSNDFNTKLKDKNIVMEAR